MDSIEELTEEQIDETFLKLARNCPIVHYAIKTGERLELTEEKSLKIACIMLNFSWEELYEKYLAADRIKPIMISDGVNLIRWDAPDSMIPVQDVLKIIDIKPE